MRIGIRVAAALILASLSVAPGVAQTVTGQREVVMLKPGEFVWYETAAFAPVAGVPGNGISIAISIPAQLAYVYRDNVLIAVSTISTGKPGKDTPTGEFTILEKQVFHRSNLYSAAPMPFMQRLTWDGVALHAGHLPGYPASHGCIRLPKEFAKKLFAITALGATVSVLDEMVDDPRFNPSGASPTIRVDAVALKGATFDQVTVSRDPQPPSLIEAVRQQPDSWVYGPSREIVQPFPGGTR